MCRLSNARSKSHVQSVSAVAGYWSYYPKDRPVISSGGIRAEPSPENCLVLTLPGASTGVKATEIDTI